MRATAGVSRRAAARRPLRATRSSCQPPPVVVEVDEIPLVSVLGGVGSPLVPVSADTLPVELVVVVSVSVVWSVVVEVVSSVVVEVVSSVVVEVVSSVVVEVVSSVVVEVVSSVVVEVVSSVVVEWSCRRR